MDKKKKLGKSKNKRNFKNETRADYQKIRLYNIN